MNCKHAQELLPLYVGRDLEEKLAKLITAHVESCAECASSANEYRQSRQLLQLFTPPPVSEAVYAGIRQHVLREIRRESPAPTLPQLVASLFRPRLNWAAATALLLVVSVFAVYFIARQTNDRRMAEKLGAGERNTRDQEANTWSQNAPLATERRSDLTERAGAPPATATSSPKSRLNPRAQRVLHSRMAGRALAVPVESTPSSPAEPKGRPLDTSVPSEKMLRVEMQTNDRNIRIIWFSHQRTQDSPRESSKGI